MVLIPPLWLMDEQECWKARISQIYHYGWEESPEVSSIQAEVREDGSERFRGTPYLIRS